MPVYFNLRFKEEGPATALERIITLSDDTKTVLPLAHIQLDAAARYLVLPGWLMEQKKLRPYCTRNVDPATRVAALFSLPYDALGYDTDKSQEFRFYNYDKLWLPKDTIKIIEEESRVLIPGWIVNKRRLQLRVTKESAKQSVRRYWPPGAPEPPT